MAEPTDPRATATALKVPCPRCRGPALYVASNRWRPFCSERCRANDLGAWASEAYRVADGAAEGHGAEPMAPSGDGSPRRPPPR